MHRWIVALIWAPGRPQYLSTITAKVSELASVKMKPPSDTFILLRGNVGPSGSFFSKKAASVEKDL